MFIIVKPPAEARRSFFLDCSLRNKVRNKVQVRKGLIVGVVSCGWAGRGPGAVVVCTGLTASTRQAARCWAPARLMPVAPASPNTPHLYPTTNLIQQLLCRNARQSPRCAPRRPSSNCFRNVQIAGEHANCRGGGGGGATPYRFFLFVFLIDIELKLIDIHLNLI